MARPTDSNEQLLCSFCGKSQRQVKKLIAGPGVYICDECIDLCNEIIKTRKRIDEIYAKHTGQSEERVHTDMERDRFFKADEAVEYGLIDRVLTSH